MFSAEEELVTSSKDCNVGLHFLIIICLSTISLFGLCPSFFLVINEVWGEQTIARLLQLIDLPLLDSLLEYHKIGSQFPQTKQEPEHSITNNYLDREILKAFGDAQ